MCVMENYVPYERHPVKDCYHIYSDGTRVSVLFERDEDKVYGRNLIAVLAFKYHIRVYCDVVMGTHFHLVGKGDPEDMCSGILWTPVIPCFRRTTRGVWAAFSSRKIPPSRRSGSAT